MIKIGHNDPRFDDGPALDRVDTLRLAQGGTVLVGDFVDVPKAIATILPRAWPDRSVEAVIDYETPDGTTWPLVLTAVALLGESAPAIDNLASMQELYGVAAKRISLSSQVAGADKLCDSGNALSQ